MNPTRTPRPSAPAVKAKALPAARVTYKHFLEGKECRACPVIQFKLEGRWVNYGDDKGIMKFKSVEDAETKKAEVLTALGLRAGGGK